MRIGFSAIALCVLAQAAAADESMRCGNWLVSVPVTVDDLLSKCGEPATKDVSTQDVRSAARGGASRMMGTTTTEKWTYQPDSQSLPMVVTIVDGKVTRIERKN